MMIKKISLTLVFLIVLNLIVHTKCQAAMVQSMQQASSYDMFLPKDRKKVITNTADRKNNPSVNYNPAIARKLFNMSDGQKRTVTIEEGTTRAHVALGSKIRVVIENIENAQWYMECSDELELINTKNEGENLIMMFDTLAKGRANIYLDCVDNSSNNFNVINSKYINIVVD